MTIPQHTNPRSASVEQRVDAIQAALDERGFKATQAVDELGHKAQEEWLPRNGARVVAKAWTDAAFRQRLLADGRSAVVELGLMLPKHHRHLVALENTPRVHNVICCTLCSCTAFTLIGALVAGMLAGLGAGRRLTSPERVRGPVLGGEVPSLLAPPPGCRFHTRCPHATPRCRADIPELRATTPGRDVACHLYA